MPTNQIRWNVLSELEDDGRQTFEWRNRTIERVRLRNGKIIEYEYYDDRKLKSRRVKSGIGDPGTLETFTYTFGTSSHTFSVIEGGQVKESYTFASGVLTRFRIGTKHYEVDTESGNQEYHSLTKIFEVSAPPGGAAGPVARTLRQAFIYDVLGNIYVPLDPNMQLTAEKVIPRFLFLSQFYDVETGLYYMFSHQWYHPELRVMANGQYPVFLEPPAPPPHPGYIYAAPPWWAAPRYPRKTIGDVIALVASSVPESVSSRISGAGRVLSGLLVFTVSIPADITVVGLVVGVPMAIWAGDQMGTGLRELWTGRHQTSLGGRLIQSAAGNGTAGKVATFGYDVIPGLFVVPATGATRLTRTTDVAEALPKVAAADNAVAATQLAPRAATVQQTVAQTVKPLQAVEQVAPQAAAQVGRTLPVLTPESARRISQIFPVRPSVAKPNLLSSTADELLEGARCMHLMEENAKVAVQIQVSGRLQPFWGHNGLSNMTLKYMPNPATGELVAASTGFPKTLKLGHSRGHAEGEAVFWQWVAGARGEEAFSAVARVTERLCRHCRHRLATSLYQLGTRQLSVGILNEGLSVTRLRIPVPGSRGPEAKAWRAFLKELDAVSRPAKK